MADFVSQRELARILQKSESYVSRLSNEKKIFEGAKKKKGKRVLFNVDKAVDSYKKSIDPNFSIPEIQIKNRGKGAGGNGDGSGGDSENVDSFQTWRTHTERYKAANAKLEYELKRGKVIEVEKVAGMLFTAGRVLRDNLLNIPVRVCEVIAPRTKKSSDEVYKILMVEIERELLDAIENFREITKGLD